jgi:hypothetical protein
MLPHEYPLRCAPHFLMLSNVVRSLLEIKALSLKAIIDVLKTARIVWILKEGMSGCPTGRGRTPRLIIQGRVLNSCHRRL